MSWYPIAYTATQYENSSGVPYSGAVLKFYKAGTTTVIPLATSFSGAVQLTSIPLNASGYPTHLGAVVIPHVEEDYDVYLYPNQAAADSNTGAIWSIPNVKITTVTSSGTAVTVPSAATVDLNSTETNYFQISGSTTITAITLAAGSEVVVLFQAALTLTNSAFLLNLTGANIVTAAGDIAVFKGEAAGVVRMLSYSRVSGMPLSIATTAEMRAGTANRSLSAAGLQSYLTDTRSCIRVSNVNGAGSTNTAVRRFTNLISSVGTDITYTDSATLGTSFTINTTGLYSIVYSDAFPTADSLAISNNATGAELTTSAASLTASKLLGLVSAPANNIIPCPVVVPLTAGDVIRPHLVTSGANPASPALCRFTITRIN